MSDYLASILGNTTGTSAPRILTEEHNASNINFVAGLSDPGEMIRCGYLPQLRRHQGEQDAEYAERIRPLVLALPQSERDTIMNAALARASLNTSNGRISAAFALKPAWHGLGVTVSGTMSSAEALRLANLDWQVQKTQLSYQSAGGQFTLAQAWGIVRSDNSAYLGTVGSRYEPIQNADGFSFLDSVIGEYGAEYESAGALYAGETVWMLARMPKQAFSIDGDQNVPYVLFSNTHDGTGAAYCHPTVTRVECANTFRTSSKERSKGISIRHTGDVKGKVNAARAALGLAVKGFEQYKDAAAALASKPAEIQPFATNVLNAIFAATENRLQERLDNTLEREVAEAAWERHQERRRDTLAEIMRNYESGLCHPQGTAYGCLQAVTQYANHNTQGRQATDTTVRASRRFESILNGERDELMQTAFAHAIAL